MASKRPHFLNRCVKQTDGQQLNLLPHTLVARYNMSGMEVDDVIKLSYTEVASHFHNVAGHDVIVPAAHWAHSMGP